MPAPPVAASSGLAAGVPDRGSGVIPHSRDNGPQRLLRDFPEMIRDPARPITKRQTTRPREDGGQSDLHSVGCQRVDPRTCSAASRRHPQCRAPPQWACGNAAGGTPRSLGRYRLYLQRPRDPPLRRGGVRKGKVGGVAPEIPQSPERGHFPGPRSRSAPHYRVPHSGDNEASVEDRAGLLPAMIERAEAVRDLLLGSIATGEQPWASMAVDGHGAYWSAAAVYLRQHAATIAGATG